jgi:SAM-dependent MidA family methyltransferase
LNHPERIIQYNIVNWLRQKHPEIKFHANMIEQRSTPQWRAIQKRMGVRKGVSDLFFPAGNKIFKGLWLELKVENGIASNEQLQFINDMIEEGYAAHIAYGYDEAEIFIKNFYSLT